jgi:transcriptional regulator with XRE-family HTH domain
MGQTAVSRRLIGEVPMDLDDLERFAAVLNVPLTNFLAEQGSSTTRQ